MNISVRIEYGFGFYISHQDDVFIDISDNEDYSEMIVTSGLLIQIPFFAILFYRDIGK